MIAGVNYLIRIRRDRLNPLTGRRMYRVAGCERNHYPALKRVWLYNQPQWQFTIVLTKPVKVGIFINPRKGIWLNKGDSNASA